MQKYILALDQGTTSSRALLVDRDGHVAGSVNVEFRQYYPQPSWVEHDAEEIWQTTLQAISAVLQKTNIAASAIAAIGITNQRETTVLWERANSKPVHNAIVWQDRRTAIECEKLRRDKTFVRTVRKKTGLVLDPYFSATKIAWILKNVPKAQALAKQGGLAFGTIDSWLLWNLTAGSVHATDVTNASRTLLFDINKLKWDDALIQKFKIPPTVLPKVVSSSEVIGHTLGVPGLPDGIPVSGIAGDQQAALFGEACFHPGEAKCTYGTGSFLLMNVGKKPVISKAGLLTTVAWRVGKDVAYALEGSAFIAGAAVQWLRDEVRLIEKSSDIEALAKTVKDNGGVMFVPALAGLGAPYWNAEARGVLSGLTRGSNRGHIARAVIEGIAMSQYDILMAMQADSKKKLKSLKVDGGATANELLMQFQADVLDCEIVRPQILETTGLGAAFLAGLAVGFWKNLDDVLQAFRVDKKFKPRMDKKSRIAKIAAWQKAVQKTL